MTPKSIAEAERALAWMASATTTDVAFAVEAAFGSDGNPVPCQLSMFTQREAPRTPGVAFCTDDSELANLFQIHAKRMERRRRRPLQGERPFQSTSTI